MLRRSRSRLVAAALVAAAHLALLIAWLQGAVQMPSLVTPPRIVVRLIAAAPLAPPAPPARPTQAVPAQAARDPVRRARPLPRAEVPRADVITSPAITMQAVAPDAAASQTAASPPAATGSLLDSEATRRALRASARDAGLAAQAGRIGSAPLSPDERLGAEVHKGARGDCLKGEYLGAGMGLLSLPFLAAAALREQCRR